MRNIKINSLVKFNYENIPAEFLEKYPFEKNDVYVFLGEISNMPGHGIFIDYQTGQIFCGYHIEYFTEINKDEM